MNQIKKMIFLLLVCFLDLYQFLIWYLLESYSMRYGLRRLSCRLQLNRNKQARGMPFSENGLKRMR